MDIRDNTPVNSQAFQIHQQPIAAEKEDAGPSLPAETVALNGEKPDEDPMRPGVCRRVFGAIGTAIGAVTAKCTVLPGLGAFAGAAAGSAIAGAVAGSALGPLGTVIGGIAGLLAGAKAERMTKIGRFIGGMVGGSAGVAAGNVADKLGYKPSETLAKETTGFTFKSLFDKLRDPLYTSHKKLSSEQAMEVLKNVQPGDLIITNDDGKFGFEIAQKLMGKTGDWTHIGVFEDNKHLLEVLISADGPHDSDPVKAFTDNHHVMILRPDYKDPDAAKKVAEEARSYFGKVNYDFKFNLKTDDKQYCQEYIYKVMKNGAPEIQLEPSSLFGLKYVSADDFIESPDIKKVWSSGSNFWINLLSKFD